VTARCPHLGLVGNRQQVILLDSPRHRCYVRGEPERVGSAHQASVCLTSAYRRCPRLLAAAERAQSPVPQEQDAPQVVPGAPKKGGLARRLASRDEVAEPEPPVRYTELRTVGGGRGVGKARRPLTFVELAVLGLLVSIILSFAFVGYAIFYRVRVGPGMTVPTEVAGGEATVPAEPSPSPSPSPSPMPTALPTATPLMGPTPIPEPTLPFLAPPTPARPAASGPPTRLVIEEIDLDIPVREVGTKTVSQGGETRRVWADLPNAGGFHNSSAYPGNVGNTVINGHRDILGSVFRYLDRVGVGDTIILYVGEVAYPYEVSEVLVVPETFASAEQRAENLRLIGYMPEERLTLVTCTPVGLATHRLLVIARPPEALAPDMPEAGSDAAP
jgi:sortase A